MEGHLEPTTSRLREKQEKLITDVTSEREQAHRDNHAFLHCVDVGDLAGRRQIRQAASPRSHLQVDEVEAGRVRK